MSKLLMEKGWPKETGKKDTLRDEDFFSLVSKIFNDIYNCVYSVWFTVLRDTVCLPTPTIKEHSRENKIHKIMKQWKKKHKMILHKFLFFFKK